MHRDVNYVTTIIAVLFVSTVVSHAKESPRVYLHEVVRALDVTGAKLVSARFVDTALNKLDDSKALQLIRLEETAADSEASVTTSSSFLKGLMEGKALYAEKKYLAATERLKKAIDEFEKAPTRIDTIWSYLQALEYLGAAYEMLDYGGDAKDVFRQRAAVAPDKPMNQDFPPKILARYQKVSQKWLKKKKGLIAIRSSNDEIRVQVDVGDAYPAASSRNVDVHRGRHRVGCAWPGAKMAYQWVTVRSKTTVDVNCDELAGPQRVKKDTKTRMKAFVSQLKRSPNSLKTVTSGRAICEEFGLDYIAIPFMRERGLKLEVIGVVFSARGGLSAQVGSYGFGRDLPSVAAQGRVFARSIEGSVKSFPYQNALATGFLAKPSSRLTEAPLSARTTRMLSQTESPKLKPKWYKSWWFWTSTVVAVGGLSAAGYYMLNAEDEQGKFELEVSW